MKLFGFVIGLSCCVTFLKADEVYRAGVLHIDKEMSTNEFVPFVYEAGKMVGYGRVFLDMFDENRLSRLKVTENVDILVLPSLDMADNYHEAIKSLSNVAKGAGVYVVGHLYEKSRCQNKMEVFGNNLVFDRQGSIVSVYRKPVSNNGNCTNTASELITFTTDFGVTFGLIMNEDILVQKLEHFKGLKNIVMTGASNDVKAFHGPQFYASWSYMNNVNLISNHGIFMGSNGFKISSNNLSIMDLNRNAQYQTSKVPNIQSFNYEKEDLSEYQIKPMNLEASVNGYRDNVCHRSLCCEFYIKTVNTDTKSSASYGLAAFDGVYPITSHKSIGVQNCAVFACSGLYKRSCEFGSNNGTNIIFERISIAANFTQKTANYPIVQTNTMLPIDNFKFTAKPNGISTHVTLELSDSQNVQKLGIFSRDFSKDFETFSVENNSDSTYTIYDYIFSENVQEFFDYLWIRLRILLVVVSIYVLEMM